ncbi:MAG: acetolactate synthase small subunit [Candidatus Pelagibacterales bacterium]|jgi:acetolactate synthase-1/3 small subunit|nr:acetolactate synthase small subunit [Pelagibacteraceae bacterium]MDC3130719.1 acetolactate synthase small subunit [bacterium]MDC3171964.1 acetolactate synthase small subunit [Pelagibacteraceae bacterium]|tara:strand:- start:351 stop:848 length:498 start_codon:yes stop_codon:yes gene_type:complete
MESKHTVSVLVDNEPGVLARVIGLISGRGYNIESLTVAEVDAEAHISRITFVTLGNETTINKMISQLQKLVPVKKAINITLDKQGIEREMALVKVVATGEKRVESLRLSDAFRAKVIDTTHDSFVFELNGSPVKIDAFIDLMTPLGLSEISRTGVVAIARGSEKL